MPAIPSDLLHHLYEGLLHCGPFDSDRALRALFVDARLSLWRDFLPEAGSRAERVRAVVAALSDRANADGENALVLLLRVLAENTPPGDACHGHLSGLAEALAAALHPDVPAPPAGPTLFDQRGQQVGTQVNVAGDYYAPPASPAQGPVTIVGDGNVVGNGNTVRVEKDVGTATPAAPAPVDVPGLRARLRRLDAVEIESLCLDYFPAVYDKFTRGLQRGEMITLLLDYCRRNPDAAARLAGLV